MKSAENSDMTRITYTGPIFFVGGAPRSGTTVTHALICTSSRMNAYHPEISYVTPLFHAYTIGQNNWDSHTKAFFARREHFHLHMQSLLNQTLSHIHRALKMPELLCVKDPLLTPYFPKVLDLLGDRVRFVTVIRHPYDVLRSRQEVARKAKIEFTASAAREIARQFNQSYQHIDNPNFGDRLLHFRYEDLLSDSVQDRIKAFTGCYDITTTNIWGVETSRPAPDATGAAAKDPWYSPKYHGSIDLSSRLSPLKRQYRLIADEVCASLIERFGY